MDLVASYDLITHKLMLLAGSIFWLINGAQLDSAGTRFVYTWRHLAIQSWVMMRIMGSPGVNVGPATGCLVARFINFLDGGDWTDGHHSWADLSIGTASTAGDVYSGPIWSLYHFPI